MGSMLAVISHAPVIPLVLLVAGMGFIARGAWASLTGEMHTRRKADFYRTLTTTTREEDPAAFMWLQLMLYTFGGLLICWSIAEFLLAR